MQTLDLSVIHENTPVGSQFNELLATDPENKSITYGIDGTELFRVDERSGAVFVAQPLDREALGDKVQFWVTAHDSPVNGQPSNKITAEVTVLVLDENDNGN